MGCGSFFEEFPVRVSCYQAVAVLQQSGSGLIVHALRTVLLQLGLRATMTCKNPSKKFRSLMLSGSDHAAAIRQWFGCACFAGYASSVGFARHDDVQKSRQNTSEPNAMSQ